MKLRADILVLVTLTLTGSTSSPAVHAAGELRLLPAEGSAIQVSGTSTLHDWQVESQGMNGEITLSVPVSISTLDGIPALKNLLTDKSAALAHMSIEVTSLDSGKPRMNRLMYKALQADLHSTIQYRLQRATISDQTLADSSPLALRTEGLLTVAGVTQPLAMEVLVTSQRNGQIIITGSVPLRMSDFEIKPPTAMLGTLHTGDAIQVDFRWILTPTSSSVNRD